MLRRESSERSSDGRGSRQSSPAKSQKTVTQLRQSNLQTSQSVNQPTPNPASFAVPPRSISFPLTTSDAQMASLMNT